MTKERCMELLNQVIDHTAVARDTAETIEELINMGFTYDELIAEFNFDKDDVNDVIASSSEKQEKLL